MQLQNKNRIAYLGALTLLFSYAEMMLPRLVPFFRLGLGNIIILLALPLPFSSFVLLTIIKSISSCLTAGTLFSPFFLISLIQSLFSGLIMFLLFRIKGKWISIYGISLSGSALSAIVQILLSSLYIGKGTFSLLGPMLLFSIFSALITAYFSQLINVPEQAPELIKSAEEINTENDGLSPKKAASRQIFSNILLPVFVILFTVLIFTIKKLSLLIVFLLISFTAQILCGRKLKLLHHIFMWIFILIANLFAPIGKVLFKIGNFSITQGALMLGISKSIKLSAAMALSQCCFKIKFNKNSIISLVFAYFSGLSEVYKATEGNIFMKIKTTLSAEKI